MMTIKIAISLLLRLISKKLPLVLKNNIFVDFDKFLLPGSDKMFIFFFNMFGYFFDVILMILDFFQESDVGVPLPPPMRRENVVSLA